MDKEYKNPFYVKASLSAIGLLATIAMLYFARSIIVPIVLATIIAILLNPVVVVFESKLLNNPKVCTGFSSALL